MKAVKQAVRAGLRKLRVDVALLPPPAPARERKYRQGGSVPWSEGYTDARRRFIRGVLDDPNLLEVFRRQARLPDGYGRGFDERCVEYPFLFSHVKPGSELMLDAGSSLNHAFIVSHPLLRDKTLHIITLAPEGDCFFERSISYLYHDLRAIPIRDECYGTIACLSTLEHIGCDNTFHTRSERHREDRPDDFTSVMRELRRVLRPGGTLLLTVPFGTYRHFRTFQQFDQALLSRAVDAFGRASTTIETFYRYTGDGWNIAAAQECAACQYVEWLAMSTDKWPDPLPVEPDHAAAARAVACVQLIKA